MRIIVKQELLQVRVWEQLIKLITIRFKAYSFSRSCKEIINIAILTLYAKLLGYQI